MLEKNKYDQKHLTTTQRIKIEKGLNDGKSMTEIGRIIAKHPTTISKEVKKYRTFNIVDHSDTLYDAHCLKNAHYAFYVMMQQKKIV